MSELSIVHISSVHHKFDTRIFHKECKTLSNNGFRVYLIAQAGQNYSPDNSNINLLEVPRASSKYHRFRKVIPSIYKKVTQFDPDTTIIHFHDPELIPLALLLKAKGYTLTYDIHEDSAASIGSRDWIPKLLRKLISISVELLEKAASRFFDHLIPVTPHIQNKFKKSKTTLIQNYPLLKEVNRTNTTNYSKRPNNILYVGDITLIRGIKEMVQAMELVPEHLNASLNICGSFSPPELEEKLKQEAGWEKSNFLGWVNRDELADIFSNSRAGLVLFHPLKNHLNAQPNKMFEYMGAGLPLIASHFPLWKKLIEKEQCGILVDPLKPTQISDAITYILENEEEAEKMGKRGKFAVQNKYNWENEGKKLINLYSKYDK